MAYSAWTDLVAVTNNALTQSENEALIAMGDAEIDAICQLAGVGGTAGDLILKAASLKFATVALRQRYHSSSKGLTSKRIGELALSYDNGDASTSALDNLHADGVALVEKYVKYTLKSQYWGRGLFRKSGG